MQTVVSTTIQLNAVSALAREHNGTQGDTREQKDIIGNTTAFVEELGTLQRCNCAGF